MLEDFLGRLPQILRSTRLQKSFSSRVRRMMEEADEVTLFSVDWRGDDGLDWLLGGADGSRPDVMGRLKLRARHRRAVNAFLFEGASRAAGFGMKCDQPHHAFLFTKGDVKLAVSVCFECGRLHVKGTDRSVDADVYWHPAFRNYLRTHLLAVHIEDLSSDLRP